MKRSRHLAVIFNTVAHDFICAHAEGLGVGVAVTYGELITAKARLFRRPLLRRFHLRDVGSIRVRRGKDVNCLFVEIGGRQPTSVMLLYATAAAGDIDRLIAAIQRLSRRRRYAGQTRRRVARRYGSPVHRSENRHTNTSVIP